LNEICIKNIEEKSNIFEVTKIDSRLRADIRNDTGIDS